LDDTFKIETLWLMILSQINTFILPIRYCRLYICSCYYVHWQIGMNNHCFISWRYFKIIIIYLHQVFIVLVLSFSAMFVYIIVCSCECVFVSSNVCLWVQMCVCEFKYVSSCVCVSVRICVCLFEYVFVILWMCSN